MAGANAYCLAISALLSTANETRLEIQPGWLQSSQARFHLGKLAISSSRQCSSQFARAWGPSTELISSCSTIVILPWGFPCRSPGERSDATLEIPLSDLGGALDPTRDLSQFQVLNLSVENFGGTSNGLRSRPSQWFLPVSVRKGDALEAI